MQRDVAAPGDGQGIAAFKVAQGPGACGFMPAAHKRQQARA